MDNTIESRRERYFKLNSHLCQLDNKQLLALFRNSAEKRGWGRNHIIKIGKTKIFVKRIAVTDLEFENPYSSKNLYRIPTFYNIGVGSAGFGVNREIISHIKTTNWVLDGSIEHFPMLYHHRILPFSGENSGVSEERHEGYIKRWNNNNNIDRYIRARRVAKYEAILFLEFVPYTLRFWLEKNIDKIDALIEQMQKTITFLQQNKIIHFDANSWNIVTDGEKFYLADFGLVLDANFDLNKREQQFFRNHKYYDSGQFLCFLAGDIESKYGKLKGRKRTNFDDKFAIGDEVPYVELLEILLKNIKEIYAEGTIKLDKNYVNAVDKYKDIILLMFEFFVSFSGRKKKDIILNHTKLRRLLREAAFIE